MKKRKRAMKTSYKVLIAAISAICLFWALDTILLLTVGQGYGDSFTVAFFAAWTMELWALAGIKFHKVKHKHPDEYSEEAQG